MTGVLDPVDVAVIGGGNAGLCAALTARQAGASVLVLECAPRVYRGGNSRHTRNLRCAHESPDSVLEGSYTEEQFFEDLLRVTGGATDEGLARLLIQHSLNCPGWMSRFGVRFQSSLRGTLHLDRTNAFFLGGGKALMNSYYAAAERRGVRVMYDAEVVFLEPADDGCHSALVRTGGRTERVRARALVLASGGFEANLDWLREVWGDAADNFIVRGSAYNRGTILRMMLDAGAQAVAEARECHAIAVDARAPRFDGGIVTRLDSIPFGIVVNAHARRFYDEGEDLWPRCYALWGTLLARQPDQLAFSIVDAKSARSFMPSVFPPIVASSIRELAIATQLPPEALVATVAEFNRAVQPGTFDPAALDDCRTAGLQPDKSHWAQRLDTPPFWAYPLRPGITFTYLGLKVDAHARVQMTTGDAAPGIFAAGEIMAGNILGSGYIAGIGMTIGTVFGRIAGEGAARHAGR